MPSLTDWLLHPQRQPTHLSAFAAALMLGHILSDPLLSEAPALLMGHDLDRSPDCLVNQHFARWFGIEAVAVMPEGLCRNAWRARTQE